MHIPYIRLLQETYVKFLQETLHTYLQDYEAVCMQGLMQDVSEFAASLACKFLVRGLCMGSISLSLCEHSQHITKP